MPLATGAALGRLIAISGPGQFDFAHVVSTNYSQYKIWWFKVSVYDVKTALDLGLAAQLERMAGQV